ncbi:MIP family channel protein [Microvirga antarctica]|uniref:MIP family channel protein n=1 Tax=Microvirga antarctica TaxID=2819233 RepID=UPI001B312345|nr:MIP family channel protein [Microvirga antarctica]
MSKLFAEAFGTAMLVLLGCGSVAIAGYGAGFPIGMLPVALAFGLSVMAMIYTIGPISGCHINPAVTLGLLAAGRLPVSQAIGYIVAQFIGGAIGAFILYAIVSGKLAGYDLATSGLGQNGWGADYLGGYGTAAAFLVEVIATFIFVFAILRVTSGDHFGAIAGLVVGLTLVLIHIVFINVTGVSVNPARSLGPALVVGGKALGQMWLFILAPAIGGVLAGLVNRAADRA